LVQRQHKEFFTSLVSSTYNSSWFL